MSRAERVERVEPCPFCGKGTAVEHDSWDNCFIVRCLHCGYTSGHIASERGAMIRHNKICRALPKPDPDWKATCAKCCDGDIEPDCEYYGEPNGCNSPIYGEHPKSAPVGNAAALRDALEEIVELAKAWATPGADAAVTLGLIIDRAKDALSAPPRNCDVGTAKEQIKRWEEFCLEHHEYWKPSKGLTAIQRCNCPCHEGNGCNYFIWAQMPYKEGETDGSK